MSKLTNRVTHETVDENGEVWCRASLEWPNAEYAESVAVQGAIVEGFKVILDKSIDLGLTAIEGEQPGAGEGVKKALGK